MSDPFALRWGIFKLLVALLLSGMCVVIGMEEYADDRNRKAKSHEWLVQHHCVPHGQWATTSHDPKSGNQLLLRKMYLCAMGPIAEIRDGLFCHVEGNRVFGCEEPHQPYQRY